MPIEAGAGDSASEGESAPGAGSSGANGAAGKPVVRKVARPYFFTPSGERVDLDPGAIAGAEGDGAGTERAIFAAGDHRVTVDLSSAPQLARKPPRDADGEAAPAHSAGGSPPTAAAPHPAAPTPTASPRATAPPGGGALDAAAILDAGAASAVPGAAPPRAVPPVTPPPVEAPAIPDPAPAEEVEIGRADAANVEIRSEEIDEILSAMPGGLLRWGISAVFLTVALLLAISWVISYPDVVPGRIVLTSSAPPVRLAPRQPGEVARVFVADGEQVAAGAPLVLLRSAAEYDDVRAFSALLDRLAPALRGEAAPAGAGVGGPLALGALQPALSALQQALADQRAAGDERYHTERVAAARAQVEELVALGGQLGAQERLLEEQLRLAERARDRARQLVSMEMAPPADADRAEEEYLQRRYALESGRAARTNNQVQLAAQRAALLELEQRRSLDADRALVALRNAHHAARAAITGWEEEHLLRAPVGGTVSFFREVRASQPTAAAEPLVAVVPSGSGVAGRVTLAGMGTGKVREGQRVIIRLDGYPHREYGTLEGRVERISQLGFQRDERSPEVSYLVDVALPRGTESSRGRLLPFRQEMAGEADVVTEELRLIQRLFSNLRGLADGG